MAAAKHLLTTVNAWGPGLHVLVGRVPSRGVNCAAVYNEKISNFGYCAEGPPALSWCSHTRKCIVGKK